MYSGNTFEMAVFYGRRRVGKTTLINEFCKTIPASANWMFPQTICLIKRYIHYGNSLRVVDIYDGVANIGIGIDLGIKDLVIT